MILPCSIINHSVEIGWSAVTTARELEALQDSIGGASGIMVIIACGKLIAIDHIGSSRFPCAGHEMWERSGLIRKQHDPAGTDIEVVRPVKSLVEGSKIVRDREATGRGKFQERTAIISPTGTIESVEISVTCGEIEIIG